MKRITSLLFIVLSALAASAQFGLKTNVVYDVTATANIGAELVLAPRWSVDVSGNLNPWTFSDGKRWKHWMLQPEARYWLCDALSGHFFGAHVHGGQYNIGGVDFGLNYLGTDFRKLKDSRYQGWFVGAGVGYGYAWILDKHWNLELELGIGYSYTRFDRYPCAHCGKKIESKKPHNYMGLTKVAFDLVYLF